MKKIFNIMAALLLAVISTSCLESNLEELEVYSGNDITGVSGVYYRYYGTDNIPGSGEVKVHQVTLNYGRFSADNEAGTCTFACQLPSNFPAAERANFSLSNVVVNINLSTAATVRPIEGSPKFGVPGDWSKPNKYVVTAANGSGKEWTCTLELVE